MNHSELQGKLFDGYDGRLAADEASEVSQHLAACRECRAQVDAWKETVHTFLTPLKTGTNPVFTQNVMRQVRVAQAETAQAQPRFFARWAFPALAMSLGGFAAVLFYVAQPSPVSADGLFLTDSQTTSAEWITSVAQDDPLIGSVVEKP